ncbi:MAG: LPP20 family lipoprotein [Campylobacterota bacterium]|nr:LPP20 family lipoprotein [Campylobacterota bacterium]
MTKTISSIALVGIMAATFAGCGAAPAPEETLDERCRDDAGVLAPQWVCDSSIEGASYAAVGIGTSKNASMKENQAMTRARAKLAYQVKTQVKAKMEDFMRATGSGDAETIDAVTTAVTKQTAKLDLSGSKKVKSFRSKDGKLYVLVAVPDNVVNKEVKDTMKTSMGNEQALWQQFQSKQALDSLDKEFPSN